MDSADHNEVEGLVKDFCSVQSRPTIIVFSLIWIFLTYFHIIVFHIKCQYI